MFKDILGPRQNNPDSSEDTHEHMDDTRKEEDHSTCSWDCECDHCLEEAIKDLADQIGFDLESEDIENIKIEYHNNNYDNCNFGCLLTKYGKLGLAVKRIKGEEIKQIIERGEVK